MGEVSFHKGKNKIKNLQRALFSFSIWFKHFKMFALVCTRRNDGLFFQDFLHLLRSSCRFCSSICRCGVSNWLTCRYWKILHPWNKSHLIMVYDLFNVLLDSVYYYFIEGLCVCVYQRYWPVIFLFFGIFIWFWYQGDGGLRMSSGMFIPLQIFGRVWEGWVLALL